MATMTPLEAWRAYCAAHKCEDCEEAVAMGHVPKRPQTDDVPEEETQ